MATNVQDGLASRQSASYGVKINSLTMALKRIAKDQDELQSHPLENLWACPNEDKDDPYIWQVTMLGPPETPYEGGIFFLDMYFSEDYPWMKPKVQFSTAVYHPNVNSRGEVCLDLLTNNWRPDFTISSVLLGLYSLMADPSPEDFLNLEIANEFRDDREKFNETARDWTKKWAV
ncbi:ubiquitin-conjugating enzyme E2-17 kDa-like [Penaeus monodon]|uniref:ubiquitin-conjugating enzyme E2-17 kDa-like n=1 Tax=Penaeus monodon TaxID=6687 RepID=UPI0018A79834|nr:ubiquitin-conjugating enzyme E2-17 kDa-like [Penaeus monodon]